MSASQLHLHHTNHDHPKLGRFLIISLVVHVVVVFILAGGWFNSYRRAKPPVYFVDLVHKPVLNPQAGRPEPRPPAKPQPAPTKPAPVKTVQPAPKPEPVKTAKPEPKPAPLPKPQPDRLAEQRRQAALDELRQKQAHQAELDALKEKLAKLQQQAGAASVPADVPIGMPEGTGDEVGVSVLSHIQAFIQQNWALSPYLLSNPSRMASIQARVLLEYSSAGTLTRYRIVEPSGDSQFDESLKRAIIKSKQLQQQLPKDVELTVIFNLKEMAETRR